MRIPSRALMRALATTLALALAVVLFSVALTRAPSAYAYGNTALWQVGLSFNVQL